MFFFYQHKKYGYSITCQHIVLISHMQCMPFPRPTGERVDSELLC
jgi:hypothetical protein